MNPWIRKWVAASSLTAAAFWCGAVGAEENSASNPQDDGGQVEVDSTTPPQSVDVIPVQELRDDRDSPEDVTENAGDSTRLEEIVVIAIAVLLVALLKEPPRR